MANNDLKISVRSEFDSSGISLGLSEAGNATQELANRVSDANSSILASSNDVANALDSAGNSINDACDITQQLSEANIQASNTQEDLANKIALSNATLDSITEGFQEVISAIQAYISESISLANSLEQTNERLVNMQLSATEADAMISRLKQTSINTGSSVADLASGVEILASAGIDASDSLDYVNTLATASGQSIQETARIFALALQGEAGAIGELKESFGITGAMLSEYGVKLDDMGQATVSNASQQKILSDALKAVINSKYGDAIERHGKSLQGAIEDLSSTIDRLKTTTGELIAPILSQALNALTRLLKAFEALPEPVKNTVTSLGLLTTITTTINASLPVLLKSWQALSGILDINTASATANATAQTASATATTAGGASATVASVGYKALATSVGLAAAKIGLLIAGVYSINTVLHESKEAINALNLADEEETASIKRRTEALKTGKNAYSDIITEASKAGAVLNRNTTLQDVEKLIAGGISLEQVKSAANKARLYAEELTKFAAESPTQENKRKASLAREEASQLSAGAEIYAKYQEDAKKSLEASLKASEELKKSQEQAAKEAEKQAKEAEKQAKLKAEIAEKQKAIAQQKAIEEHTEKSLASIEEKRKKVIEAKAKTDLQALDTALQRTKALLRDDETIAKNAKAREAVEKRIRDLVEERKQKEEEIANIRKSAEKSLSDAQERYNKERITTIEGELSNTQVGSKKYFELKSELDKRQEQSSIYERQGIIDSYKTRIEQAGSIENANILRNALKYDLLAQNESKTREQAQKTNNQINNSFAQYDSNKNNQDLTALSNNITGVKNVFDDIKTAGQGTEKSMSALANIDLTGLTSAFQSLTTAAMGCAGALSQLATSSKSSNSGGSSFSQNISINGNMQGSDVDTNEILKIGMQKLQKDLRDREKYSDIFGG